MDIAGIKAATGEVIAQLPQAEAFIDAQLAKVETTLTSSLNNALAGFADGLSQALALGYSIDGASVSVEFEPITIRAKFTVSMPLKGAK